MSAVELATAYISLIPSMKGASDAISKQVVPAAGKAGSDGGNSMGSMLMGGLKKFALPIAGVFAAFSVKKFITDSTSQFETLASSVKGFGRIAGGSVAQYSGLAGAMKVGGVDVDAASGALTIFSKNLGNAAQNGAKTQAMVAKLGTGFLDAKGQVKPMSDILPGLADKFKTMPDGAEKTALAMQLFGRSGAQMIPFLNQGSAGITQLTAKAKEMGLVMDDQSMRILVAAKASARDYTNAITGMKAALGQTLLPVMTAVSNVGRQIMIPVFEAMTKMFTNGREPVMSLAGHIQDFANRAGSAVKGLLTLFIDGKFSDELGKALGINQDSKIIGVFLTIRQHILEAFEAIHSKASELAPLIMPALEKVGDTFGKILAPLAPLVPKIWELASSFSPLGLVLSNIGPQIPGIVEAIVKLAGVLVGALGDALKVVLPVLADLAVKLADGFAKFAADALPGLQAGLDKLMPMISNITEKLTSNTSIIYGAITAWAIWSAVTGAIELGGTIAGLVESIQAWGGLIQKIREATVVQWLLNAAQNAMPILIIIAIIAALVASFIWAYNNVGWFKDAVDAAFKWIQNVVSAVVSWFQTDALPFLSAVWDGIATGAKWLYENAIKPAWEGIMAAAMIVAAWYQEHLAPVFSAFGELFATISAKAGEAWNFLWKGIQIIWTTFGQPVFDVIVAVLENLTGHVGSSTKKSGDFWADLWSGVQAIWAVVGPILGTSIVVAFENIGAAFKLIWDVIVTVFKFVWDMIVTILNTVLGVIQGVIEVFTGLLTGNWDQVWHGIATIFGAIWTGMVNTIGNVIGLIGGIIGAGLEFVSSVVGNILGGIGQFFGDTWNNISNGVRGFIDSFIGFFRDLPGNIMAALSGAGSWLFNVGKDIINGLISGVQSMIGAIGNAILSLVPGPIVGVFKDALGIHSPSRVFRGFGQNIVEGLILGTGDKTDDLTANIHGLVTLPDVPSFRSPAASLASAAGSVAAPAVHVYIGNEQLDARMYSVAGNAINSADRDARMRPAR